MDRLSTKIAAVLMGKTKPSFTRTWTQEIM